MFSFHMPTEIFCGRDCVRLFGNRLKELGGHAFIVTGKSSAKNGSLGDVLNALSENGQQATVFDRVIPNPDVPCVREGISLFCASGADFLIGLGGGSPMDAAKAIALLAKQDRKDEEIFSGGYAPEAFPMAHIPTTAGTGSEVTPYSVLTNYSAGTKTSLSSPALFPKFAFLDGKYTQSLSPAETKNTAIDAFSHAAESLLSRASSPASELFAAKALEILFPLFSKLDAPTCGERDELLYASALAGIAIAQTGTTAVHGMGYALTYHLGIPHGRANGLLLGETLKLCKEKEIPALKKIEEGCRADVCTIGRALDTLLGEREAVDSETLREFAKFSAGNKNIKKSAYEPTPEEIERIFVRSFREIMERI